MRRLFLLSAIPLLCDVGVAACLSAGGHAVSHPLQTDSPHGHLAFLDWDRVERSATIRRVALVVQGKT
jgi:hypothetical protein